MKGKLQTKFAVLALAALALAGCQGAPAVKPVAAPEPKPTAPAGEPLLELAGIFTDNIVLQRDTEVPVWGLARPGDRVTVTLAGRSATAEAGPDGSWRVNLPALKAGKAGEMAVSSPADTLIFKNVAVGDVWLCAGQSNMELLVRESEGGPQAAASADYPDVRLFRMLKPENESDGATPGYWRPSDRISVGRFSAVAYYYGLRLYKSLNIPVGLVEASWGGSTAESWISAEAARSDPVLARIMADVDARAAARDSAAALAAADTRKAISRPKPAQRCEYASKAFDIMMAPIVPYAVRGVVWYQGETNAIEGRGVEYRVVLRELLEDWRRVWGNGSIPFLLVQLPAYGPRDAEPAEGSWAELREAQLLVAGSMKNVHMAVTVDLGHSTNVHPANKEPVGSRLALAALEKVYGKKVVGSGPTFESMRIEGSRIVIAFGNAGGGLKARSGALRGFAVAGEDRRFAWAEATIEGDKVVVSSADVTRPVAVRYGWADNPACNLCNHQGLPASPFRTDDWPRPSTAAGGSAR